MNATSRILIKEEKKSQWPGLLIVSLILIFTILPGIFLYQKHGELKLRQEFERIAKIKKEKELREQIAADQKAREEQRVKFIHERHKKIFDEAIEYAEKNMDKPLYLTAYFKKVEDYLKGTEFESDFKAKSEKFLARAETLSMQKKVANVMSMLGSAVAPLIANKEYREAATFYRDYCGEFASESKLERSKKALYYLAMTKKQGKLSDKKDSSQLHDFEVSESGNNASKTKVPTAKKPSSQEDFDPKKIRMEVKVNTDTGKDSDGNTQTIYSKLLLKNSSDSVVDGYTVCTYIVCQDLSDKKKFALQKIMSCDLSLNNGESTELENDALSVYCDKAGKNKKLVPVKYEGCIIVLKNTGGKAGLVNSSSSKLRKIEQKIVSFEEGTVFNKDGVVIDQSSSESGS
ncbi:MAG: hypothetical protein A2020_02450 [Lentisphaerae bacterium GWF2_45_14]|nr:MAG: hypothetical protein A2020_02450 [Lentisphaerae bacterium GWF2_45_14]